MNLCKLLTFPGGGILSSPKTPAPPPPPPPVPTREDPAVIAAREKERQARLRQGGPSANILTAPSQGVLSEQGSEASAAELGS